MKCSKDRKLLRFIDIILAILGLVLASPIMFIVAVIGLFDTGSPFFLQERVGRYRQTFTMIKFRTMHRGTASVATHLVTQESVTSFGNFLRRTKLDELPQLWNVVKGEMSLVGPRPNLPNQDALILEREKLNVYSVRPGITGLAQLTGINMATPSLLAETDAMMISRLSLGNYFKYILITATGKGSGDIVN